jgi:excisionase family DNA binding protein
MAPKRRKLHPNAQHLPIPPGPSLLTLSEVARLVGVSQATLRRWRQRDPLPVIQVGRTVRISPVVFQQWLERRAPGTTVNRCAG